MKVLVALVSLFAASALGGCFTVAPTECLNGCAARHQSCVTQATSDNALKWCDYHQQQCTRQCHGGAEK